MYVYNYLSIYFVFMTPVINLIQFNLFLLLLYILEINIELLSIQIK